VVGLGPHQPTRGAQSGRRAELTSP
jgi:hypothetical protein